MTAEQPPKGCRFLTTSDKSFTDGDWLTIDLPFYNNLNSDKWTHRQRRSRQAFTQIIANALAGNIPTISQTLKEVDPDTKTSYQTLLRQGENYFRNGLFCLFTTALSNVRPQDMEGKFAIAGIIPNRLCVLEGNHYRAIDADAFGVVVNAHTRFVAPPSRIDNFLAPVRPVVKTAVPDQFVEDIVTALLTVQKTYLLRSHSENLEPPTLNAREMNIALNWMLSALNENETK